MSHIYHCWLPLCIVLRYVSPKIEAPLILWKLTVADKNRVTDCKYMYISLLQPLLNQMLIASSASNLQSGEDPVSVMFSGVPLPWWYCTILSCRDPPPVHRRRCTSAPSVCCDVDTDRAVNETRHTWRPRLPGSSCTRLERLTVFYPGCVLPGTEDSAVFIVIWRSRLTAETVFLFSLLSGLATVFCDNVTLISTFYSNNNNLN